MLWMNEEEEEEEEEEEITYVDKAGRYIFPPPQMAVA